MNRIVTRGLALSLFLLAVAPVLAQRQPGGQGGFGGGFGGPQGVAQLVTNKSVQEELKLTDDQIAAFKKANDGIQEKFKDDLAKAKEGKDRTKSMELRKAMTEETNKVMTKVVDETLKPEQAKRLKQIEFQVGGTRALATNEELQKTLKLSETQIGEIKAIRDEAAKDTQELMKGAGRGGDADKRAETMKKVAEITKETTTKTLDKLTPEQKKQWEEITGPKFEMKREQPKTRPGV